MKKVFTIEAITSAQIEAWKKEYPRGVFEIVVPESDDAGAKNITGYFRKPDIDELGIATQGNQDTPLKVSTILYNTCLLGGHPLFEKDEDVRMAALKEFKDLVKTRTATIKKL